MRDGARIVVDIHRPADEERHPAILMRSYGRRFGDRNLQLIRDLVDAGYAYVNSEVRGRVVRMVSGALSKPAESKDRTDMTRSSGWRRRRGATATSG